MEKPHSIVIVGRLWRNKHLGHTTSTSEILVDGKVVYKTKDGSGGGSGTMYVHFAAEWLEKNGYLPGRQEHGSYGYKEELWQYCERNGIALATTSSNVPRRKDL